MMYLLLRDNKQTGPYTFDELKAKGLKAYDLVWVEGRSAAWRYPSEIDELRAFSPAVEEQPFDRFFKKPGTSRAMVASAPITASEPAISNTSTVKRTIYVTMPGGVSKQVTRDIPMRESVPVMEVAPEVSPAREVARMQEPAPAREAAPLRETVPVREAAPLKERAEYSSPRPEYRRASLEEILPVLPRRKSNRPGQLILVGFTVMALLGAGIFIGLSIQKDSSRLDSLASNINSKQVRSGAQQVPVNAPASAGQLANNSATTATTPAGSAATSTVAPGSSPTGNAALTANPATVLQAGNTSAAGLNPPEKKHRPRQKPQAPTVAASQPPATDSVAAQPQVTRREAVHRTDPETASPAVDKEGAKVALANQVSVGTNKFEVGTFGGIHNLQVTVTNRSAFALDLVVVQVDYIQANKKTYKSENLYFRGIAPGSALMLEAPKTSRGINIQYKITSIASKELGLSEPGT